MRASFLLLRKLRRKCVRREDRLAGHSWIHSSILVQNAFYEKERDLFFSWITEVLKAAE